MDLVGLLDLDCRGGAFVLSSGLSSRKEASRRIGVEERGKGDSSVSLSTTRSLSGGRMSGRRALCPLKFSDDMVLALKSWKEAAWLGSRSGFSRW